MHWTKTTSATWRLSIFLPFFVLFINFFLLPSNFVVSGICNFSLKIKLFWQICEKSNNLFSFILCILFLLQFSKITTRKCSGLNPFLKPHWYFENIWSKRRKTYSNTFFQIPLIRLEKWSQVYDYLPDFVNLS